VTYVHNGLYLSHYSEVVEHCPVPGQYILSVCRHVHKKGVDTLLRAFALVLRDQPTLSLVLVGGGPLFDEHKTLARTLGIDSHVTFVGNVDHVEVAAFFDGCSLFVLPSRSEPFGLVLLEAAYYKKGIVGTCVGGIPEIIMHGVNGVLVEPDDPAGMAEQIVSLLRQPELAEQLGREAYQNLMRRFLWKERILDYIAIYEGHSPLPKTEPDPAEELGLRASASAKRDEYHVESRLKSANS
jgi:glycosyltransferase involved in cell wall biosynthesis